MIITLKWGQYAKQKTIKQTSKQLLANFEIQSHNNITKYKNCSTNRRILTQ